MAGPATTGGGAGGGAGASSVGATTGKFVAEDAALGKGGVGGTPVAGARVRLGEDWELAKSEVQFGVPSGSPDGRFVAAIEAPCSDRQLISGRAVIVEVYGGATTHVELEDAEGVEYESVPEKADDKDEKKQDDQGNERRQSSSSNGNGSDEERESDRKEREERRKERREALSSS